jgi:hypothetical protein
LRYFFVFFIFLSFLVIPGLGENKIIVTKLSRKEVKWFKNNIKTIVLKTYSSFSRSHNRYYPAIEALVIRSLQKKGYNVKLASDFWTIIQETPIDRYRKKVEILLKSYKTIPTDTAYLDLCASLWNFRPFKTYSYWKETYRIKNTWGNTIATVKEPYTSRKYYMVGAVKADAYLYFARGRRARYKKYVHIEKKSGYNIKKAIKTVLSGIPKRKR